VNRVLYRPISSDLAVERANLISSCNQIEGQPPR
jgi:hypothetical protein